MIIKEKLYSKIIRVFQDFQFFLKYFHVAFYLLFYADAQKVGKMMMLFILTFDFRQNLTTDTVRFINVYNSLY